MAERCPDCGRNQRKAVGPEGDFGVCLSCESENEILAEVRTLVDELFGRTHGDEAVAFAFGLADNIDMEDMGWSSKSEEAVAAACVYLGSIIAGDKLTQSEIEEVSDANVTRETYAPIYEASGYEAHYGPIEAGKLDRTNPWFDIEGWRAYQDEQGHSKNAIKSAASNVRRFAIWYDGDGEPTVDDVRGWLDSMTEEYAADTIEGRFNALRKYLDWADAAVDVDAVDLREYIRKAWKARL